MRRGLLTLARLLALLGGLVLVLLILVTCLSIIGRTGNTIAHAEFVKSNLPFLSNLLIAAGIGPVTGDFELVEAGIAFAIFAFLPWCQLMRGHANVDLIAPMLSWRGNRLLDLVWEAIMAAVTILIALRLYVGMADKQRYGETTFLLQFPVWWAYLASLVACTIAAVVALYVVYERWSDLRSGTTGTQAGEGAWH